MGIIWTCIYPSEVFVLAGIRQIEFLLVFFGHAGQHAIKDVIVPLGRILGHNARFLQQVLLDIGSFDRAVFVEADVDVLAETRRVVISHRFGVSER